MGEHPVETWHRLVSAHNPSGLNDFLAEDAVFYSPVVHCLLATENQLLSGIVDRPALEAL